MRKRLVEHRLPSLALSHGQALWVLRHALPPDGRPTLTFDAYIKYLRREGVPFAPEELGRGPGQNVVYAYEHLMELGVALTLRAQSILPADVAHLLAEFRNELRPIYRIAYTEQDCGRGMPILLPIGKGKPLRFAGIHLDLGLHYHESGAISTTGPKALGPDQAVISFITRGRSQYFKPLIALSDLAIQVVTLAVDAPDIKRGRQS